MYKRNELDNFTRFALGFSVLCSSNQSGQGSCGVLGKDLLGPDGFERLDQIMLEFLQPVELQP
jgi:hypothetical protein